MKLKSMSAAAAALFALPAAAYAGHVESAILRQGTPARWWKENKTQVLERLKRVAEAKEAPTLEDHLGPDKAGPRSLYAHCLHVLLTQASVDEQKTCWGSPQTWRADLTVFQRRYADLHRTPLLRDSTLDAKAWLTKVHEGLTGDPARLRRLDLYLALDRVREALLAQLQRTGRVHDDKFRSEKEIADLVLILKFLKPENKAFILNGYSNDAINPGASYGSLYPHLKWDARSVDGVRKETFQVLADIGAPAVPLLQRALSDLKSDSRDGEKTVGLPPTSLATSTQWSTKDVRFRVPVHPSFRKEAEELIDMAKRVVGVPIATFDLKVPAVVTRKEEPAVAPPPVAPADPLTLTVARRREEILQYSGVRSVVASDGAIRVEVATEEDADELRLLLGDEAFGVRLDVVVGS